MRTVTFEDVVCNHDTEKAIVCTIGEEDFWIPKSQIHDDSEVYKKGTDGILIISEWIAMEKGLV